ncbi:MAG: hypothetical protein J7577_12350 [Sphingobacteriaceae bacterium]|nr:hypothetical protein [Sphingobacteriaceae bacterium]
MKTNMRKMKRKTLRSNIPAKASLKLNNSDNLLSLPTQSQITPYIDNEKSINKSDNLPEKIAREKEDKLVNLITKVLVRTTLEELYGKEGN